MPRRRNWRKLPWYVQHRLGSQVVSRAHVLWIQATHRHCRVRFEGPVRMGPGFRLEIPDAGTLTVGRHVDFRNGFQCEIYGNGRVTIGEGTIFTSHCLVQCTLSIDIGRRCTFGQSALIYDGTHRYEDLDTHWLDQGYDFRPIRIGDAVGVSDKCTIHADVGERSMIASHSVVNRDIPEFCVASGAPARVVRYFGPPERRPASLRPDRGARPDAEAR